MKRLASIFIILIFPIVSAFSPAVSEQKYDTTAKIKAVYIYNFTKYIEWPEEYKSGEFTIGILGKYEALFNELTKLSKQYKMSDQSFAIKNIDSPSKLNDPHILFIPDDSTDQLSEALEVLKGTSTLVITETAGLANKGAGINFIVQGNRQKFELNKSNVESRDLKVASTLEQLAVLVNWFEKITLHTTVFDHIAH